MRPFAKISVAMIFANLSLSNVVASSDDQGLQCMYNALPSSEWRSYDLKLARREISAAQVGEQIRQTLKSCSAKRAWKNQKSLDLSVAYALTLAGIENEKQTLIREGIDPDSIIALRDHVDKDHHDILDRMSTASKAEMDSLYQHLSKLILTKSKAKWRPAAGAALVLIMKLTTKQVLEEEYRQASQ